MIMTVPLQLAVILLDSVDGLQKNFLNLLNNLPLQNEILQDSLKLWKINVNKVQQQYEYEYDKLRVSQPSRSIWDFQT